MSGSIKTYTAETLFKVIPREVKGNRIIMDVNLQWDGMYDSAQQWGTFSYHAEMESDTELIFEAVARPMEGESHTYGLNIRIRRPGYKTAAAAHFDRGVLRYNYVSNRSGETLSGGETINYTERTYVTTVGTKLESLYTRKFTSGINKGMLVPHGLATIQKETMAFIGIMFSGSVKPTGKGVTLNALGTYSIT